MSKNNQITRLQTGSVNFIREPGFEDRRGFVFFSWLKSPFLTRNPWMFEVHLSPPKPIMENHIASSILPPGTPWGPDESQRSPSVGSCISVSPLLEWPSWDCSSPHAASSPLPSVRSFSRITICFPGTTRRPQHFARFPNPLLEPLSLKHVISLSSSLSRLRPSIFLSSALKSLHAHNLLSHSFTPSSH